MKFIISNVAFYKAIDEALKKGYKTFKVIPKQYAIEFSSKGKLAKCSVESKITESTSFKCKINVIQFYELSLFLKQLPHHPITVELSLDENKKLLIILTGLIQKF